MESKENLLHLRNDVQIRDGSLVWRTESAVYDLDHERMDFYGGLVLEEGSQNEEDCRFFLVVVLFGFGGGSLFGQENVGTLRSLVSPGM